MNFQLLMSGLFIAGMTTSALADEPINTGPFGDVAIKGYDTVAYFTESRAVKGSSEFAYDWLGTPWHFNSAENRELFKSDPTKYAPQYGGYCTLGVGLGANASENIDPVNSWRIIDGKLYFISDPTGAEMLDHPEGEAVIAKADANWEKTKPLAAKDYSN
ncbi:YHS domain-containing (seleno)protein [Ruegeria lacuscaerulensis]|uniref:YHS domain-containing (seleno)protein n=1 Tax=Ruegeria lacuscaerulensis TaxID=55218 RepID=UPI00148005C0|nr:YHS domain-containing (seleno)protein [Ruegeria lacuscaerulensis]